MYDVYKKISLSVAMATNLIQQFGLNSYGWQRTTQGILLVWLVEDYPRNITVKLLSKYLQSDINKGIVSLFHYKSIETFKLQ